jgi:hypothetical protein
MKFGIGVCKFKRVTRCKFCLYHSTLQVKVNSNILPQTTGHNKNYFNVMGNIALTTLIYAFYGLYITSLKSSGYFIYHQN